MKNYSLEIEEDYAAKSACVREIIQIQINGLNPIDPVSSSASFIPKTLIRFWHDISELPNDVRVCMATWDRLANEGFALRLFDDDSARSYIKARYGQRMLAAFTRCEHPAMRCDYLRMCVLLADGGLYVDTDDALIGEGWKHIFENNRLKIQPLCYDNTAGGMMPSAEIWRPDLPTADRIFYVNNDPIAAPPGHPLLQRALERATEKLLGNHNSLDIQATTGPGNLTTALIEHAHALQVENQPFDFELLRDWDSTTEVRWNLSYRNDERNWRNVYGC